MKNNPKEYFSIEDFEKYKTSYLTTRSIIDEALRRNINVEILDRDKNIQLEKGGVIRRFYTSTTSLTDPVGIRIASNKESSRTLLKKNDVPTPQYVYLEFNEPLPQRLPLKFPVVIKPAEGTSGGKGVFTNIENYSELKKHYSIVKKIAATHKSGILIEELVDGEDFRALVINFKDVKIIKRIPAHVVGDGKSTVKELLLRKNQDPRRGDSYSFPMFKIKMNDEVKRTLAKKELTFDSVPSSKETVFLRKNANLTTGGETNEITDTVPNETIQMCKKIAVAVNLNIVGIDIISQDISKPLSQNNGKIIEINDNPGFNGFLFPTKGKSYNPSEKIVQMLFK
ncbi:MAG: cyanophycin synthetase [uncultured bacterium]|nr:MAG: cyanophycin synthetase [uncultured bacterium]